MRPERDDAEELIEMDRTSDRPSLRFRYTLSTIHVQMNMRCEPRCWMLDPAGTHLATPDTGTGASTKWRLACAQRAIAVHSVLICAASRVTMLLWCAVSLLLSMGPYTEVDTKCPSDSYTPCAIFCAHLFCSVFDSCLFDKRRETFRPSKRGMILVDGKQR